MNHPLQADFDAADTVAHRHPLASQGKRIGGLHEPTHAHGVAMLDASGAVAAWNPTIARLLGANEASVVGQPLLNWLACELPVVTLPGFDGIRATVAAQGCWRLQARWRRQDGHVLWCDCVVTPMVDPAGRTTGYVAVIRDISEEHQRTQRLLGVAPIDRLIHPLTDALNDPTTGLHNRRGLEQQLAALALRPTGPPARTAWVRVDIDHFKRVNDTHGHDGGDAVLKAVVAALKTAARDVDPLARLGGEKFALLLPDATAAVGFRVAERLRLAVQALAVRHATRSLHITASFGVAEQPEGEPWPAALERADAALVRAQNRGCNRVVLAEAVQRAK